MKMSVLDEARISPQTDAEIRAGLCACFPVDVPIFSQTRAWHGSGPEYSVVLEDADRVIAHVGLVRRTITVGETPLLVAGVQNVYVLPDCQGKGYSSRVLEEAMAEAGRRGFDCGLLFCRPSLAPVYTRCNWRDLGERQVIRVEEGRELPIPGKNIAMFYPIGVADFPEGMVHLRGNDW